ncbi:MAG: choice-of-anchor X domain-containing protein [Candidatus Thiodiazotropha sp.]
MDRSVSLRCLFFLPILALLVSSCASPWISQKPEQKYPLVSEIAPGIQGGSAPWVEIYNPSREAMKVAGLKIVIDDVLGYSLPEKVTALPSRGYITVVFDGKGETANKYNYKNKSLTLHAPAKLSRPFRKAAGQLALYYRDSHRMETLVGFIAWGAPASKKSQTLERNAHWRGQRFIPLHESFGDLEEDMTPSSEYSIGLYPGGDPKNLADWVVYSADEISRGKPNLVPSPKLFTLSEDAVVRSEDIAVGWRGNRSAAQYRFQLAKDPEYKDIVDERILKKPLYKPEYVLPEGVFYYRVKVIDKQRRSSEWSETRRVFSKSMKPAKRLDDGALTQKVLTAMVHQYQRKDTGLLCLDSCASDLDGTTVKHWDNDHPNTVPNFGDHGDMNCVRASISMMVSYYGGDLSQDRIAYYTEEAKPGEGDGTPEGDLAHGVGMSYSSVDGGEETDALEWALDTTTTFMDTSPTFTQIRGWIDADQPIMTRTPGHLRTMNGYRIDDSDDEWVHILDPWSGPRWETFATWDSGDRGTWVGPVTAPTVRSDETSVAIDSDADGIMDFDELERFATGRFDNDSDNDSVNDKNDIREYVFDAADIYAKRTSDQDIDGTRKEVDPDNDADTFNDGCEDSNYNGKYEPGLGETDNFSPDAGLTCGEKPIHAIVVFDRSGSMVYPPSDPVKKYDEAASATVLFLDTWLMNDPPSDTMVGLVFYDDAAYFDSGATTNTTLDLLSAGKRDQINASFAANYPDHGSTSIGGGLLKAMDTDGFNIGAVLPDSQHRTVIVLTDGRENANPRMNDAAVTQGLGDGHIDGYVLGIGDGTQIDVDKLNHLADILNHYPSSLATDLDDFEVEKFFLQILAETQGLEFSTDPGYEITVGGTDSRSVPVAAGTQRVNFVVVWNNPSVELSFTLNDPSGTPVVPDIMKQNQLYHVATIQWPDPGNWTLEVNAQEKDGSSAPQTVRYGLMALEKNTVINTNFSIARAFHYTDAPILLTADLATSGIYLSGAEVTVEAIKPTIGFGSFISRKNVTNKKSIAQPEKQSRLDPLSEKLHKIHLANMRVPVKKTMVKLNDNGKNGDAIAGDGRYSAYFSDTGKDGIYKFRFVVRDKVGPRELALSREKTMSVVVKPRISSRKSEVRVIKRDYLTTNNSTSYTLGVIPMDRHGNMFGPGYKDLIQIEPKNAEITDIKDNLDGSYTLKLKVPGRHTGTIGVRLQERQFIGTWPTPE